MDKIIAISESSPSVTDIEEKKFVDFMREKPIWEHFSISKDKYLTKTNQEKTLMIRQYYDYMVNGKIFFLLLKLDIFLKNISSFQIFWRVL